MNRRTTLPAKLTARRQDGAVLRTRLFERLDAGAEIALTWVQGPAGAGKTTLVSTWASRGSRAAAGRRAVV